MSGTVGLGAASAVALGAAIGALARWRLAVWLNLLNETLPPGTLAANLMGLPGGLDPGVAGAPP